MAYLISEEAKDLLQDVHEFCENEVKEQCKAYDISGEWPKEIYDKAIEMQLHSLEVPEEYGGPGLSRVDVAALIRRNGNRRCRICNNNLSQWIRNKTSPDRRK
ncbi:MAG: acyl-CoA dehydrogenase family protein [Anaerostipes sp.]